MKDPTNPEENQRGMLGIVPNDGNQNPICKAKEVSNHIPRTVNVSGNDNTNPPVDTEKEDDPVV